MVNFLFTLLAPVLIFPLKILTLIDPAMTTVFMHAVSSMLIQHGECQDLYHTRTCMTER